MGRTGAAAGKGMDLKPGTFCVSPADDEARVREVMFDIDSVNAAAVEAEETAGCGTAGFLASASSR